jgi:NAD-dependent SIR2 family protein deacetylase
MKIFHNGFTFEYSDPKKSTLSSERRYFCRVIAPLHGLIMGSIVWFGEKEPMISTVLRKVKEEADFHISNGNVK